MPQRMAASSPATLIHVTIIYGPLEAKVKNRAYNDVLSLKRAWEELDQDEVGCACNLFTDRVRK